MSAGDRSAAQALAAEVMAWQQRAEAAEARALAAEAERDTLQAVHDDADALVAALALSDHDEQEAAFHDLRDALAVSHGDTPTPGQAASGEPGDGASAVVAEEGRDV